MWIVKLISGLFSMIEAALSAYTRTQAVEEGKRMVREEMYEEMVKRTERAKDIHATSLDELIRLRSNTKASDNRHEMSDDSKK